MLMNKILRYSFMALLAMMVGNVMASESVDFTAQGYANAAEVAGYQGTDFTITFAGNGASNSPKWYNSGTAIRMYAKNSMTITSSKTIIGIKFTLGSEGLINENNEGFSTGTYDRDNTLWTGSTSELILTNVAQSGNQIRLQKLDIYFQGDVIPGGDDPVTDDVQIVSIAEFNAAEVSNDVWYQLTGTISNLKENDQYGNFDIADGTGSVYVYGLLSEKGGPKKQFQELAAEKGIKNGCKLTLIGNRGEYNGKIEVMNAYFVSVEEAVQDVKDPEFSVASGLYLETQSVAMSCEEGARILYTVAVGNDPEYIDDENYVGMFYDGNPLTVSKSTIIKAMAVKNGKTSNIVTANYTIVNTTGKGTVESPFSVADALLVIDALDNGQKTADEYVIKGSVTEVTEISLDYGNATFKIADAGSADVLTVFRAKDANGENITDENYVKVGDKVAVQGKLQKYVSGETVTPEVAQGGKILSVESEVPLPELPTVDQQPIYKFTAKGQWGSYTFNKTPFRAADYKGFRIEYSNMNEVSEGAAFNILINSNETHLGQDWSGAEAQVPNKTAYKNFGFDAAHTVFEGDFSDFVATDDPATTCPTIAQFALQACAAGNTVIIKKVVFIKQDNTEVLPEYKGDDWGGGAYTIEEVTDGINTINADKAENGVRYNLAGQKVNNGFKGVVIMNGKKMLQK